MHVDKTSPTKFRGFQSFSGCKHLSFARYRQKEIWNRNVSLLWLPFLCTCRKSDSIWLSGRASLNVINGALCHSGSTTHAYVLLIRHLKRFTIKSKDESAAFFKLSSSIYFTHILTPLLPANIVLAVHIFLSHSRNSSQLAGPVCAFVFLPACFSHSVLGRD